MAKQKKYEFNQQFATLRLREPINEGRVMFTIDDERVDSVFNNQFEADVDYIHDGPDVYYVTDQNDLERFVDYIESQGLNGDAIQVQQYFKEDMGGNVTGGGEAYNPALDVPSKKQNPFKEGKQEYFIQVDVRDAKTALAIIDDSYSLSNSIKKRGSDVYTTYDVMAAEELVDSLKQNGIRSKNNVEGYVDEDVLSGYTQVKNFRPGHTDDKGGFQYKDLWGLNEVEKVNLKKSKLSAKEYQDAKKIKDFKAKDWKWDAKQDLYIKSLNESADDLEPTKQKVIAWSRGNRNEKQDSLAIQWFKEFEDAVMNSTTKQEIRDAILDMYYADDNIFDKLGLLDLDYDDSEKSTDPLMKKSTSNEEELQRVKHLLGRANQEKSYSVMSSYEDRIKKLKFLVALEKKINDKLPILNFGDYWVDYVKNKLAWNGNPNKFAEIASHVQDLMEPPYKAKMETLKEMNQIVHEVFNREDYIKVLQIIDKIKYTNTKLYNAIMDLVDDLYPHDYKEVEKLVAINENYSRFKNETKTRTKPEQFHQAVKSVKRKVEEINKLYEYMERLKLELSENSDGLKYKKYTENAILKIKEAVKALHVKTKKLK